MVVKEKPEINPSHMKARALYAEDMIAKYPPGSANRRRICTLDEKLFCAEDTEAMFEVLPGEDMKAMPLFRPRKP